MTTKTFTTRTDAIAQLIVPALGNIAGHFDLDGLADHVLDFDFDREVFFQSVTTDEFWEAASQHELQLDVEWNALDDDYNAVWKIVTTHLIEQDAALAGGAFKATEDEDESLVNLDEAVAAAGYKAGDRITHDGDYDSFDVSTN